MEKSHCCELMKFFINEGKVDIYYSEKFRSYGIGMKNGTSAEQIMVYCPWCGNKLPLELGDQWFDILEHEYNIIDPTESKNLIPPEFQTEEWWKKRGL